MSVSGWIGVDLDGTLAHYDGWSGGRIGQPIGPMMERVRAWVAAGVTVKVMTARAGEPDELARVRRWLDEQGLHNVTVTDRKDWAMVELWDDRAVSVERNTGRDLRAAAPEQETTP